VYDWALPMQPIAEFLSRHPPFKGIDQAALDQISSEVEVEYFPAGEVIFRQGEEPMEHVRVVRSGAVELLDRSRVLDRLGEGEMFGHPSMLSGLPTGLEGRAADDALCYRLPAETVVPLLAQPEGLRFLARSLLARPRPNATALPAGQDPTQQPSGRLVRDRPVVCDPSATVRDAARRMAAAGASSALIRLADGNFGILTDHDLRERVVAAGVSTDAPVTAAMSAPAYFVGPDRFGAEVMLEMLERGIRHVPVVSPFGDPLGVLTDVDLLATETRTPFSLRREIDEAASPQQLRHASARLRPAVITLHDAGVPPAQISGIIAIVADALTRRLIELAIADRGRPPTPLAWIALGSLGRRELVPSSDIDSALAWDGAEADPEAQRYAETLGERVSGELAAQGFPADQHGATAGRGLFVRSIGSWRRALRHAIERPSEDKGLILLSLMLDGRVVEHAGDVGDLLDELRHLDHRRSLRMLMLRLALAQRPPTGFMREFVVEDGGEHRGHLDIKRGGLLPIIDIARYASFATGARAISTPGRLRVASTAGALEAGAARTLAEAFELFWRLRLEHQIEQLRHGVEPDDYLDPKALNQLTRRYLRDAFHAVRTLQRSLAKQLRSP
jgi:CBS domain-containing protein